MPRIISHLEKKNKIIKRTAQILIFTVPKKNPRRKKNITGARNYTDKSAGEEKERKNEKIKWKAFETIQKD